MRKYAVMRTKMWQLKVRLKITNGQDVLDDDCVRSEDIAMMPDDSMLNEDILYDFMSPCSMKISSTTS